MSVEPLSEDQTLLISLYYAASASANELDCLLNKEVKAEYLTLGLSPLHAWICMYECLLHIAYRLDFKCWQIRGQQNKKMAEDKKRYIQENFRKELGLLVDIPKQKTGNTNDGNTARKFFRNAEISAKITGISLALI